MAVDALEDVLQAERTAPKVLPKMERPATDATLRSALADHAEATEAQIGRRWEAFEMLGEPARGARCDAMLGLIDETEGLMADIDDGETKDAALIARCGSLVAWAKPLGRAEAAALLRTMLDEERPADRALSKLAEARLDEAADAA